MATENINDNRHLVELSGSDYEIADGEPDIKGWAIKYKLGSKLGEVEELLFNPSSRKVRYLIAHLDARVFGIENRKVLIPIGLAELHETHDEVFLPGITIEQLANAPDYRREKLSLLEETSVRNAFSTTPEDPEVYNEQTFYEHDHYNERNFYGRRFVKRDKH